MTPIAKKVNIDTGTHSGLGLYASGLGGVYRPTGSLAAVVARPPFFLTRLRDFFTSATNLRLGVSGAQ